MIISGEHFRFVENVLLVNGWRKRMLALKHRARDRALTALDYARELQIGPSPCGL